MPSRRTSDLRSVSVAVILALISTLTGLGPELVAQDAEVTWQSFRIERNEAPGTYITFQPPVSTVTPYKITWGATGPGSQYVFVGRLADSDSVILDGELSSQYILELVSSGSLNIRRASIALEPPSPLATPGYAAHDFQGARTASNQTASGDRSVILGGASNRASGSRAAVGGGLGNYTQSTQDAIVGGQNNSVSSSDGAILGGSNNTVSVNDAVIFGGANNSATSGANRGVILGGSGNSITANQAFIGGGVNNTNSGDNGTLFGGYNNTASGTHAVLWGGWTNQVTSTNQATLIGGRSNLSNGNHVFIGGGSNNYANSGQCVVFGGFNASIAGNQCVGLGGQQNQTAGSQNTLFGGQGHTISGSGQMAIGGGQSNQTQANYTAVNGGHTNIVQQQYSTILGGTNGTLNAQNGLLFNAGSNAITLGTTATALLNNVDIWIAGNEGTPRQVRFYEQYGSTGAYPAATTNFVAFRGPNSTLDEYDNTYTLPDRIQTSLPRALAIAASPAPTTTEATTEWASTQLYAVTTVAATGTPTTISAANLNVDQPVKINPNNTPANRRIILSNGTTDGMVVTLYVYNATAGNGIRLLATDTNLALAGGANVDLDQNDSISFVWDNTSTKWIEIGRSAN